MVRKSGEVFDGHMVVSALTDDGDTWIGSIRHTLDITAHRRTEAKLRKSEFLLAEVQEITHLGNWEFESTKNKLHWSEETYRLLGADLGNSEPTFEDFLEFVHPDDVSLVRTEVGKSLTHAAPLSFEHRVIRPDGEERILLERGRVVCDTLGRVERLFGTAQDVTETRLSERALRKSHDELELRVERRTLELRTTLETLVEGVITTDDHGVIETFNRSAETLFGYTADEVIGRNVRCLMTSMDSEHHDDSLRNYLATGAAKIIGVGREVIALRKDGTTFPMRLGISDMEFEGQHKFVGTVQDITKRRQAEEALREREGIFRALTENTSDFILVVGVDDVITYASPAVERNSGYSQKQVVGKNYDSFALSDDLDLVRMAFRQALENPDETHYVAHVRARHRDGHMVHYEALVTDMTQVEGVNGIVVNLRDTTERTLMEEAAEQARARTRELQRRMDDALESIRDGFILLDPNDRVLMCNDAFRDDFEPIKEFLEPGTPFEEFLRALYDSEDLLPKSYRTEDRFQERLNAHRDPEAGPWTEPTEDGRWILVHEYRTRNGGIALIRSDITTRVAAETALAERESELRTLTDLSPVGIFRSNLDGQLIYVNECWRKIMSLDGAAALGEGWTGPTHPDDRDMVVGAWRDFVSGKAENYQLYCRIIRPDGSVAWVISQAIREYGEDGEILGFVGCITDITGQKNAEQALAESEEKFRAMTENTTDIIVVLDKEGIHKYVGPSAARAAGMTADDLIGEPIRDMLHPEDVEDFLETLHHAWQHPGETAFLPQTRVTYPGGRTMLFEALFTALPNVPGVDGIVVNARDIATRKRTEIDLLIAKEQAEAANRAKSEFLSSMSHELRTPMNAILGFAQLLEQDGGALTGNHKEFVTEILRAGHHMMDLITEVLDLAKIESGNISLDIRPEAPRPLIETCLQMIDAAARKDAITVDGTYPDRELPLINVDALRFKQILLNLLSNAVKYNRTAGRVGLACERVADHTLRISVSDTGAGIPVDRRYQVFEPFNRLGLEVSNIPGTGIGLAVTKQLIESMGGEIGFTSAVGEGSTFWIDVPLTPSEVHMAN